MINEGGGTVPITIKKSTIQGLIGGIVGAVTGTAIAMALDSLAIPIATAIEVGTAGVATLAVGAFLIAWHGWALGIASSLVGTVVGTGASKLYKGGNINVNLTNKLFPNYKLTV